MNNTIFRRKFVVGVLIALVLGFGMLGTADALDSMAKTSGDVAIIGPLGAPTTTHDFGFSLTGVTDSVRDDTTTTNVNERNNGDQISISASGGYITEVDIGGTSTPFPNNTTSIRLITMGHLEDDSNRSLGQTEVELPAGAAAVTVTIRPNRLGAVTLQVSHSQRPTGTTLQRSLSFVAYAVRPDSEMQGLTIDTSSSTQSPQFRFQESPSTMRVQVSGQNRNYVRVEFASGDGNLTVDWNGDGNPDGGADNQDTSIITFTNSSGVAEVQLAPGQVSSVVTASIPFTSAESHSVIYAYRSITLAGTPTTVPEGTVEQLAGTVGDTGTATEFTVTATDGVTPTAAGIGGLEVTFEVLTAGGELMRLDSFETGDTTRDNYDANFETNGKVITNNDGAATVNLKLGREPGIYMVRATTPRSNSVIEFEAKAVAVAYDAQDIEKQAASIEVTSGNGQRAGLNQPLANPLVVVVRNLAGLVLSGVEVTFSTDSGAISFDAADGDYDATAGANAVLAGATDNTASGTERGLTIKTDKAGSATVKYNVGEVPGAKKITAVITAYDSEIRQAEFNLNESETITLPVTGTLDVSAPASGTAGDTITVTVTASGRSDNANQRVSFSSNRGGTFSPTLAQTNSNGIATTQFTLPSTPGAVTITATASDYTDDSTTITVQSPQPAGTLSVLTPTTPITGTAGETIDIIINVGNQNVTVELSGTGFQTVSRTTGNATTVTIPVRLPNTAGNYVLTASASGYTDLPIGVSVSEASTPTPTNVPVRLTIPSGTDQTQSVAIGSSATLRVRVINTDTNSGQSGVEVTFSDISENVLRRVNTNNNGEATYEFTVTSTRAQTVVATITDDNVDASGVSKIFTITGTESLKTLEVVSPGPGRSGAAGGTMSITIRAESSGVLVTLSGAGFQTVSGLTDGTNTVTLNVVLPDTTGFYQTLNASAAGYHDQAIHITVTEAPTPTNVPVRLTIPSGTDQAQTVAIGSSATLRVLVTNTDTNSGQSGVEVTFRDSRGNDLATPTTNNSGEATYQLAVTSTLVRTVTAIITDTDVDTSGATAVTFTITGTATQPTPTTSRLRFLNVLPTGATGAVGAPYNLTVYLLDTNNIPQANQYVSVSVSGSNQSPVLLLTDNTGTARTNSGITGRSDTFTLPTTAGTYTITATLLSDSTVTAQHRVTVFGIQLLKDTSDSVSGDNQEGNRGEVLDDPFVVKVVRTGTTTAVQGVPVTWTVTDGDGELSTSSSATSGASSLTVNSDANGNASVYLVLGDDDEDNEVRASTGITGVDSITFSASGLLVPYELEIVSGDNQNIAVNERSDPLIVRVTDEDGDDLEGVTVTFSSRGPAGATLTRSAETDRLGEAEADFVSRSAGTYTITARVTGIPTVTFTITVGNLADSIRIVSGNNQRGDTGTQLANPLVVEVLDDDGDTVSGVTVTFRVTGGGGSLSATSVTTNSSGRAQTTLTLGDSPGGNSVRASVSGVSTAVTFAARAVDPAPPEPVIHLGAGQRVDTYWINTDSGTLHRLVGSSVENIAPGVENVVSLVVTSDRLYWVETTSETTGRLRRSNLNGSNIQLIRDLTALPAGITVDTANSKIYMTNGWGKVQAINLDGSGYAPNLITGLTNPKDIAVGSGKVYWITGGGTVHSANVDGTGVTQIASGYSALGSIAVGSGKVFWTEAINESDGNIHSANLDGSSVTEVVSLLAAPYGISVDASASKLYFTNSRGRLMQSDLNGGGIQIVASNLVSPGDVAVSSGTTTRAPGTFSKYDVNRDGRVDNTDAALVANALGESPPSDPRLDVNGDGSVNFLDLLLVFDNRDESNAAPVAVASERPKVSREEVQHQIDLLLATDNHSATAQFTLAYLQSLLEVVTPEQTRLLANYPNPFNPETWIPYQLAASSKVQITIYNSAGKEVRTLSLGHQSEGYYTDRSRAAYWDGRNAIGERVSSGVYFYTLITDRMSATRKMLILK